MPDLAHACLDLLIDGESGIWHLANDGLVRWDDLAQRLGKLTGIENTPTKILTAQRRAYAAPRPLYSALSSEHGKLLPALEDAIARYVQALAVTNVM